jgi:hypothetical protein
VRRALIALVVVATGCDSDTFSGDPFPVLVEPGAGPLLVFVRECDEDACKQLATIDILSPLTVVDRGAGAPVKRRGVELTVLGRRIANAGPTVPRARLSTTAYDLHPCAGEAPCKIGDDKTSREISVIIGADALAGDALRLELGRQQLFILPDIAPDSTQGRARACDAVMTSPFSGGGTLLVGGTELSFTGRRIALPTCLSPNPNGVAGARGVDALLLISTGIGPTILSRSAYERWLLSQGRLPSELPDIHDATVLMPSGEIPGVSATIDALALVGNSTSERGACDELHQHYKLADDACTSSSDTCAAAGAVVLTPTAQLAVLVVDDDEPVLQALRDELRPELPEVDGILGTAALAELSFDVDYPHDRVLARCAEGATGCVTRPTLQFTVRHEVKACLDAATP